MSQEAEGHSETTSCHLPVLRGCLGFIFCLISVEEYMISRHTLSPNRYFFSRRGSFQRV